LLFAACLAIRAAPEILAYEPDLFAALPLGGLLCIIAAVGCFAVVLLFDRNPGFSATAASALTGITMAAAVVYYAPWLRGYELYGRADLATHLATTDLIAQSGLPSSNDFYPVARVVAATLGMTTSLRPEQVFLFGRVVMTIVFMAGSVILARISLGTSRWDATVAAAAAIPIAGAYTPSLVPAEFAVAMSPALVSSVVLAGRGQGSNTVAAALIVCTAMAHPLVATIDIILLGAWAILASARRRLKPQALEFAPRATSVALLGCVLVAWITPFAVFRNQLVEVRDVMTGASAESTFARMLGLADRAGFGVFESIRLAVLSNLGVLIILAVAFPVAVSVLVRRRAWPGSRVAVGAIAAILIVLGALTLVAGLGLSQLDPFRFIQIATIVTPVCVGLVAVVLVRREMTRAAVGIAALFAVSVPLSAPSPALFAPSMHVRPGEVTGIRWAARASTVAVVPMGYLLSAKPLIAYVAPDPRDNLRGPILSAIRIPDHLTSELAAPTISSRLLLPVSDFERFAYGVLWASAERFTMADFVRLDSDDTISKPFAGSAIDIYLLDTER
jgi:hypothetical protein